MICTNSSILPKGYFVRQIKRFLSVSSLLPLAACGGSGSTQTGDFTNDQVEVLQAFANGQSLTTDIPRAFVGLFIGERLAVDLADDVVNVPTGSATYTGFVGIESRPLLSEEEEANRRAIAIRETLSEPTYDFGLGDEATFSAAATMTAVVDFDGSAATGLTVETGQFFEQTDRAEIGPGLRLETAVPIEGSFDYAFDALSATGSMTQTDGDVLTFEVPMTVIVTGEDVDNVIGTGTGTQTTANGEDVFVAAGFFGAQ